jgi:hypothetical protein
MKSGEDLATLGDLERLKLRIDRLAFASLFSRGGGSAPAVAPAPASGAGCLVDVSSYPGANFGAKLQAAHDAAPATGAVLDCRCMTGAQAITAPVVFTKEVQVYFGVSNIACSVANAVTISSGTWLLGAGGSQALFGTVFTGSAGNANVFRLDGTLNIIIQNLKVTYDGANAANVGIYVLNSSIRWTFDRLEVVGIGKTGVGILTNGALIGIVRDTHIGGWNYGIDFTGADDGAASTIEGCWVESNATGTRCLNPIELWFSGSTYEGNSVENLRVTGGLVYGRGNHWENPQNGGKPCIHNINGIICLMGDVLGSVNGLAVEVVNDSALYDVTLYNCLVYDSCTATAAGRIILIEPNRVNVPADVGDVITETTDQLQGSIGHLWKAFGHDTYSVGSSLNPPDSDYTLNIFTRALGLTKGALRFFNSGGDLLASIGGLGRARLGCTVITPVGGDTGVGNRIIHSVEDYATNSIQKIQPQRIVYDEGLHKANAMAFSGQPANGETVTFNGVDTTNNTQGGDFNNVTDPLTVVNAVVNYPSCSFAAGKFFRIASEIIKVTLVAGNDVTFARAQQGTAVAAHANGLDIFRDPKIYTFQTVLTNVDGNVFIGATAALSRTNLVNAINLEGIPGTEYAALMTVNPDVWAQANTAGGISGIFVLYGGLVGDPAILAHSISDGAQVLATTVTNVVGPGWLDATMVSEFQYMMSGASPDADASLDVFAPAFGLKKAQRWWSVGGGQLAEIGDSGQCWFGRMDVKRRLGDASAYVFQALTDADGIVLQARADGYFNAGAPPAAPADANVQTSTISAYLDEAGNNLLFKVKYSDGATVKIGTIAVV